MMKDETIEYGLIDLTATTLVHKIDNNDVIWNTVFKTGKSNKLLMSNMTTVVVGKATSLVDGPLHNHIWSIIHAR